MRSLCVASLFSYPVSEVQIWSGYFVCRLVYWLSLNVCSSWRGFGSGLTVFPLLAAVALNLFLIYTLKLKEPLLGSQDVLYNQVTPSSWSGETSQGPSDTADILPTDILDAQWGGELRFLLSKEEIFPEIGHSCGRQLSRATRAATITFKLVMAWLVSFAPPMRDCSFKMWIHAYYLKCESSASGGGRLWIML